MEIEKIINKKLPRWILDYDSETEKIVISTRARLARNIKGYPYLYTISEKEKVEILNKVENAVLNSHALGNDIIILRLNKASRTVKEFLKEKFLATEYLLHGGNKEIIFNNNMNTAIFVNEEDHIRIQSITAGFHPKKVYNIVSKIERKLENFIDYDFSTEFGYLTSCPTNIGTGLRISAMIHIPALNFLKKFDNVVKMLKSAGFTIRGFSGEGSAIIGDIYQISNQITLGVTENNIISKMNVSLKKIIDIEKESTNKIINTPDLYKIVKNKIIRSYNALKHAKTLELTEAFEHLAVIRFSLNLNINIKRVDYLLLNKLFILIQPIHLLKFYNIPIEKFNKNLESTLRARLIQKFIRKEQKSV